MSQSKLITIASFSFPYEAQIAKANLEVENIPAFIADEHTINMQWLYSNAMGGVRLQVPHIYADQARNIISQDLSHLVEAEVGKEEVRKCQKCGGKTLFPYTKGKKPAFLMFFLLGFPLFFYRHGLRCRDCGEFNKT